MPKTLASRNLPGGSNLLYERTTHDATITQAKKNITDKGVDGAAEFVRNSEPSAETTATGYAVIDEYVKQAQVEKDPTKQADLYARAGRVAEDMSVKMTSYGQAIEAAKTVGQFGTASAIKTGQKIAKSNNRNLAPRDTAEISDSATRISAAEAKIKDLERIVKDFETKQEAKRQGKRQRVSDQLSAAETEARERLARLNIAPSAVPVRPSERGAVSLKPAAPEQIVSDLATVLALKVARGESALSAYRTEMATEFGDLYLNNRQRVDRVANGLLKDVNARDVEPKPPTARQELADDVRRLEAEERRARRDAAKAERQAQAVEAKGRLQEQRKTEAAEKKKLANDARQKLDEAKQRMRADEQARADKERAERQARRKAAADTLKWDAAINADAKANPNDPVAVGAEKLVRGLNEATWRKEMAQQFPDASLDDVFVDAYAKRAEAKAAYREVTEVRQAESQGAVTDEQIAQVRRQLKAEQQKHRDAQMQLARTYDRLSGGRAFRLLSTYRKGLGLLSSFKTHARNIAGNTAYQAFDEVARVPGAIMDFALSGVTKQRGLTGPSPTGMLDGVIAAVKTGGREAWDIVRTGQTAEQAAKLQVPEEANTGSKIVDLALNATFRLLSAEDRIFYNGALKRNLYDRARAQALTEVTQGALKRVDVSKRTKELTAQPTEQLKTDAEHDALVATFNNNNKLSDAIRRARGSLSPGANFALDMVMPYDRTPTNIVARLLEATPLGYIKNARQAAQGITNRAFTPEEQRQFSQTFGRATVGSGILALGYRLAAAGVMSGLYDDDEKKRVENREKKVAGQQPMAIKVGDQWFQVGGLSPIGNLLAAGASLYEKGIGSAPSIALDVMFEQPLARAAQDLKNLKTEEGLRNKAGSMVASFLPAALSDIATGMDTQERKSSGFTGRIYSRIPGLRQTLPADEAVEHRRSWALDPFHTTTDRGATPTQVKSEIIKAAQSGDTKTAERMTGEAVDKGIISEREADALPDKAAMTELQSKFRSKPIDVQIQMWNALAPEQQKANAAVAEDIANKVDGLFPDDFIHMNGYNIRGKDADRVRRAAYTFMLRNLPLYTPDEQREIRQAAKSAGVDH